MDLKRQHHPCQPGFLSPSSVQVWSPATLLLLPLPCPQLTSGPGLAVGVPGFWQSCFPEPGAGVGGVGGGGLWFPVLAVCAWPRVPAACLAFLPCLVSLCPPPLRTLPPPSRWQGAAWDPGSSLGVGGHPTPWLLSQSLAILERVKRVPRSEVTSGLCSQGCWTLQGLRRGKWAGHRQKHSVSKSQTRRFRRPAGVA